MKKFFDTVVSTTTGRPLSGAQVRVRTTADTLATLYSDSGGTALANPVTTDSNGLYEFFIADGTYTLEFLYGGDILQTITDVEIAEDVEGWASHATRALLAASGATAGTPAMLTEEGREGLFVFDGSNLSAEVAADTLQGVYVPPSTATTGASGAWVRRIDDAVHPEWWGAVGDGTTDDSAALAAALSSAHTHGVPLRLRAMHVLSRELVAADGVDITGPRDGGIKRLSQVRTTTTAAITSGGTSKTVTVASTTGFVVGQSVMFAWTDGSRTSFPSSSDSYNHRNPVITAIDSGSVTVAIPSGSSLTFPAIPSGAHLQTAGRLLILLGNNSVSGITINDNEDGQTEALWTTMNAITVEGDEVTLRDVLVQNSFSDSVLIGGPSGSYITGFRAYGVIIENCGANGFHFGNSRNNLLSGCQVIGANLLSTGLNEAHQSTQGGCVTLSDNCADINLVNCRLVNGVAGVGSIDGSTTIYNYEVRITGGEIVDCYRPVNINTNGRKVIIQGVSFRASYNSATALFSAERWDSCTLLFHGTGATVQTAHLTLTGCQFVNVIVSVIWGFGGEISNNIWDMYDMQASAATLGGITNAAVTVGQSSSIDVSGNIIFGGRDGIAFRQDGVATSTTHRECKCNNNMLFDQRFVAIRGTIGAPATELLVQCNDNLIVSSTATDYIKVTTDTVATTATSDGAALSSAAGYAAIVRVAGMSGVGNRIRLPTGSTWSGAGLPANWRDTMVNGAWEVPAEYADDAAAAAASVPIGGIYRTASALKIRVA